MPHKIHRLYTKQFPSCIQTPDTKFCYFLSSANEGKQWPGCTFLSSIFMFSCCKIEFASELLNQIQRACLISLPEMLLAYRFKQSFKRCILFLQNSIFFIVFSTTVLPIPSRFRWFLDNFMFFIFTHHFLIFPSVFFIS